MIKSNARGCCSFESPPHASYILLQVQSLSTIISQEGMNETIDIVLPVHNEGASIGKTLKEFYDKVHRGMGFNIHFVVCEDGSTDNTVKVLQELARTLPIRLITGKERKGYSKAVVDGLRATTAPYVCFIDADGQCDPADFKSLFQALEEHDMAVGYRNPRADHWIRILMSRSFHCAFSLFFSVPMRDPSCPYLIIRRRAIESLSVGHLGILKQGFWWEFSARAVATALKIAQVPVKHRLRADGATQVYKPTKVPRIAYEHLLGLFDLRRELQHLASAKQEPKSKS